MSAFISSSGLSPGSHEAEVQWAQACLNCTEPSAARSSYWSLPVGLSIREVFYGNLSIVRVKFRETVLIFSI